MKCFAALAVLLLASACASVPMAPPVEDQQGKRFEPAPIGKASLYVYRESAFGGAYTVSTSMGQRLLGPLAADTWFQVEVEPGTYDMRCIAENTASLPVSIGAGETRFVEVAIRLGIVAPRCAIFEVTPEKGRQAVTNGRRAAEIR